MKNKDSLIKFLSELNEGDVLVGFDPVLVPGNLRLMRKLVDGEKRSDLAVEFKISSSAISRIKTRFTRLYRIRLFLIEGDSTVPLPEVFALNFNAAARYAKKHFCPKSLTLPNWRIRDANGGQSVFLRDI